ncbi:hypothetical protein HMI49_28450 [Corallococcus exercitus]|uniref:Kelch-like protein n=1 Tax=Corallococcus exercitus TaxID=2316736 RepID=A0A7Y4KNT2_9BACT|nr:hypothetical protein [Corallococcus exercitus]NOK37135.1 hypothetical protein [Corallococcus exercitus]
MLVAGYTAVAELYDPATNTWTNTGSTTVTHSSAPSVTRPDGSILMAGGSFNTYGVELYTPSTGSWITVGSITQGRTNHPTIALADGRVLFIAGTTYNAQGTMQALSSVEVFDPTATCAPTTCTAQGKNCGTLSDGCGGTLSCGTCGSGQTCGSNNVCTPNAPACSHNVCTAGTALVKTCSSCVNTVCTRDSYCCTTAWDSVCVNEASQWCAIAQPGCVTSM